MCVLHYRNFRTEYSCCTMLCHHTGLHSTLEAPVSGNTATTAEHTKRDLYHTSTVIRRQIHEIEKERGLTEKNGFGS